MNLGDVIAIVAVALVLAGAICYIVRAKRRGQKCVGCPYSKGGCTSCSCQSNTNENKEIDQ